MRTLWMLSLLPLMAAAQVPPPELAGVLLERDASAASGQFSVRAADFQVFRFQFDLQTRVEREQQSSDVARLRPGDKVEVESEAVEGSLVRRARLIRVTLPMPPPPLVRTSRTNPATERLFPSTERLFASANLTFSGVVSKFTPQRLVLHTRDGDRTLFLRQDTGYVADGGTVGAAALRTNMRVYVLAGKDLYERLEAYRIIWGSIFDPGR